MKKKMSVYVVCLAVMLSSATGSTPVLDRNGDEVRAGVQYKIYSIFGPGGVAPALKLARIGNNPCPLDIILTGFRECFNHPCGLPLTFHPEKGDLVSASADVNIKFEATTSCQESTVWQIARDEAVDTDYVSTGGVLGNEVSASWFRMEAAEEVVLPHAYKLVYCPRNVTTLVCSNIGFEFNDPRLSLIDEDESPFHFTIGKATVDLASAV